MVLKSVIKSPEIGGSLLPALCYGVPGASGCHIKMATVKAHWLCTEGLSVKSVVSPYLRKLRLEHLN